jgi:hypothetical protein
MYFTKTKFAETDKVFLTSIWLFYDTTFISKLSVRYIQAITITQRIQRVKGKRTKDIINHLNLLLLRRYHTY